MFRKHMNCYTPAQNVKAMTMKKCVREPALSNTDLLKTSSIQVMLDNKTERNCMKREERREKERKISKIVAYLSCSAGREHLARTN